MRKLRPKLQEEIFNKMLRPLRPTESAYHGGFTGKEIASAWEITSAGRVSHAWPAFVIKLHKLWRKNPSKFIAMLTELDATLTFEDEHADSK